MSDKDCMRFSTWLATFTETRISHKPLVFDDDDDDDDDEIAFFSVRWNNNDKPSLVYQR